MYNIPPDVSFTEQAGDIAAPVAPSPAEALLQKLGVVLKSRLHFTLWMILHVVLPSMRQQPAGNEIVIVGIQLVLAAETPPLIREAARESWVLQDF